MDSPNSFHTASDSAIDIELCERVLALHERHKKNKADYIKRCKQLSLMKMEYDDICKQLKDNTRMEHYCKSELPLAKGILKKRRHRELEEMLANCQTNSQRLNTALQSLTERIESSKADLREKPDERQVLYQEAFLYYEAGRFKEAYTCFNKINNYRDVKQLLNQIPQFRRFQNAEAIKTIGNIITFGNYKQSNHVGSEKSPVEWIVIDKKDDEFMIISRYPIDTMAFHIENAEITWEYCSLRAWMNHAFLKDSFSTKEEEAIIATSICNNSTQCNPVWATNGGNDTVDKVFLLSYQEALHYFKTDFIRKARPTEYAIKQKAFLSEDGCTFWWLRSPGRYQYGAASVYSNGSINGNYVSNSTGTVRPAMWINLEQFLNTLQ